MGKGRRSLPPCSAAGAIQRMSRTLIRAARSHASAPDQWADPAKSPRRLATGAPEPFQQWKAGGKAILKGRSTMVEWRSAMADLVGRNDGPAREHSTAPRAGCAGIHQGVGTGAIRTGKGSGHGHTCTSKGVHPLAQGPLAFLLDRLPGQGRTQISQTSVEIVAWLHPGPTLENRPAGSTISQMMCRCRCNPFWTANEVEAAGVGVVVRKRMPSRRDDDRRRARRCTGCAYGVSRVTSRGNRMASRMFGRPSIIMRMRSIPMPHPPCGGMP